MNSWANRQAKALTNPLASVAAYAPRRTLTNQPWRKRRPPPSASSCCSHGPNEEKVCEITRDVDASTLNSARLQSGLASKGDVLAYEHEV
eukprot:scaffold106667_cov31-Tisochrysis_lutea.AAC.3